MSYNIELCPIKNPGKAIHKTQATIPSTTTREGGFNVPIKPISCTLRTGPTYEIPLSPINCNPYKAATGILKWEQETEGVWSMRGTVQKPTNYWIFSCSIPQGISEGTCAKCFSQNSAVFLYGNLGFSGGSVLTDQNSVQFRVHRDSLPFPGEMIFVVMMVLGNGDMLKLSGSCASPDCGAHGSDCMWGREVNTQTSGNYWMIANTYFATPTWTGGYITDYYTETLGWAGLADGALVFPDCEVYGDATLKYKIRIEGTKQELTSSDFAGYGIGTFVAVKKLGEYEEPFDDGVLGGSGSVIVPWHIMGMGG